MHSSFIFDQFTIHPEKREISFEYTLQAGVEMYHFLEKIRFSDTVNLNTSDPILRMILQSVHIALGMSYWKLYCPEKINILSYDLSKPQATFWNTIYTKGLGEFYYNNAINFKNLVQFPFKDSKTDAPVCRSFKDRSLVGIGGGKDSIVTARLLQKAEKYFDGFVVETQKEYSLARDVASTLEIDTVKIRRELDVQLFERNKLDDTYNGHIPISVIYAFLGVLSAYLYDYRYVVVSNEKSSDYGNIEYQGQMINHQWSKSSEFEQLFQNYLHDVICPNIHYFSLLRPLSELQIAQLFSSEKKFHHIFSSCNRNFAITHSSSQLWCGECPKCAFTFILMSSFISKKEVVEMFGSNLLDKSSLLPVYKQLLGIEGHKPFECVGTREEAIVAMQLIHERGEFEDTFIMKSVRTYLPDNTVMQKLKDEVFLSESSPLIPTEFQNIISILS